MGYPSGRRRQRGWTAPRPAGVRSHSQGRGRVSGESLEASAGQACSVCALVLWDRSFLRCSVYAEAVHGDQQARPGLASFTVPKVTCLPLLSAMASPCVGRYYSVGDERRGNPTLIAVSSFGESLPRVTPLTAPAEAFLTRFPPQGRRRFAASLIPDHLGRPVQPLLRRSPRDRPAGTSPQPS